MAENKEARKKAPTKESLAQSREEIAKKIYELSLQLVGQIDKSENPSIAIPVRGSRNVEFDKESKKIVLGEKIAHRYLFNVGHARKFMQTMLVASYVKKDLLDQNLTATLRDLYYAKKRTIAGTKEDTIDEQKESDLAIVDFEVALDTFREKLHLRAEPKGRIAGEMIVTDRVRDKVDTIDLGHMGSGGWAVPSIVEQIEFKDVDAEYVLVAEKNALFDRLNEDDYWKKNKCLIMTTAGQAARGARRFLQRLNDELKLPVYCLSVDAGEPILIKSEDGLLRHRRIGEYVNSLASAYGLLSQGQYYETTLAFDQALQVTENFAAVPGSVTHAIRHPISEDLFEVITEGGNSCRVTKSHSLMAFDPVSLSLKPTPTSELKAGDFLAAPSAIPNPEGLSEIDVVEEIKKVRPRLLDLVEYGAKRIWWKKSKFRLKRKLKLGKKFCRLLGYYVSEGSISGDGVVLTFGFGEQNLAQDAANCAKECLGLSKVLIYPDKGSSSIRVIFGGLLAVELFSEILGCGAGASKKSVPDAILNVPISSKKEFLHGCFLGDGNLQMIGPSARISLATVSRKLAADLVVLLKQIGCVSTVKECKGFTKNAKNFYKIFVADAASLRKIKATGFFLAERVGVGQEFSKYLQSSHNRSSKFLGVPKEIVTPLAETIRRLGGKGIGRLLCSTEKHVPFGRLEKIMDKLSFEAGKGQKANAVFEALSPSAGLTQKEIALKTGINKQTINSCLLHLCKEGCAKRVIEDGKAKWVRGEKPFVEPSSVGRAAALKDLVKNKLLVLPIKEIRRVKPTSGFVYDLEVPPTHTFLGGMGSLCLHNTDADPYGWYIFSTMRYGSMALAHESDRLGCPNMKFLGMSISDIEHYDLRNVTIKAKDVDIKRAEEMKGYEWFKHKEWQNEINKFLEKKIKAEIQALSSKSLQYVSNVYLPEKIKSQDFLP